MKLKQSIKLFGKMLFNIPFASYTMAKVGCKVYKSSSLRHQFGFYNFIFFSLFLTSIVLSCLEFVMKDIWVIGLFFYLCFCTCLSLIRRNTRHQLKIEGNVVEDFLVSVFLYPCAAVQLELTTESLTIDDYPSETEENKSLC